MEVYMNFKSILILIIISCLLCGCFSCIKLYPKLADYSSAGCVYLKRENYFACAGIYPKLGDYKKVALYPKFGDYTKVALYPKIVKCPEK